MFPANFSTPALTLFIAGDTTTNGVVTVPGLSFSANFSVTPGVVTSVVLPSTAQETGLGTVGDRGIHVVANADVTVYGLSRVQFTTDAFLALPTAALGTEYINLGYENVNVVNGTQFGIVATQAGTVVTINPTVEANGHPAGTAFTVTLNQGQTYQLRSAVNGADLSGTIITSTHPIAVFGGHQCANIPRGFVACDYIVEALTPVSTWGRSFVTLPLATRTKGDTFRFLASQDNTVVSVNGTAVATLNRGQFREQVITGSAVITATKGILVAQYSNSSSFDGVTSDPFMMLIPPYEQFLAAYTVTTPASGFATNFINLAVPSAGVGQILLDGVAIPAASFTPIGTSGFSGVQKSVALGSHTLSGPVPFGAFMYGFASFDSYGYPGGYSTGEVAKLTTIALTPKTGSGVTGASYCVSATLKDQRGNALPNIRVDFKSTGANASSGFDTANASGVAQYCYSGTKVGTDTITASVGSLSNTATKVWTAPSPVACDIDGNGKVDSSDIRLIDLARNTMAAPNDPRDYNKDGIINILDSRQCTLRCTKTNCAP